MSHLPSSWFNALDVVAQPAGLPHDQVRMLLCLLAAIPLGEIHKKYLHTARIKHIYSFIVGFFFSWFVVGNGAFHVLIASILVYILAYYLPRKSMPYILTIALVAYLSYAHIYRYFYDYLGWEMDVSLIMMIFVVKASTFAFNYSDGLALNHGEVLHPKPHIHEHRRERALTTFPSLLEYLSYIWFFAGVLVGPCFEIKEYLAFTDLSLLSLYGLSSYPSTILPALRCLIYALLCYPAIFLGSRYPMMGYVNTKEYTSLPFMNRFTYFWLTMTCSRYKYYFAWYLGEAGCVATGLALSGVSGDDDKSPHHYEWDRVSNVHALNVELATSMPQITNNWNIGINNWLKHYIYFRVDPPRYITRIIPAKSCANIITKLTAAFWHGFYPAYYLFFVGAFVVNEMDDAMRANIYPRIQHRRLYVYIYNVIAWFLIFFSMNSLGMAFMLLKASWSIEFWSSLYWSVFWIPLSVLIIAKLIGTPKSIDTDQGKRQATKAQQKQTDDNTNNPQLDNNINNTGLTKRKGQNIVHQNSNNINSRSIN